MAETQAWQSATNKRGFPKFFNLEMLCLSIVVIAAGVMLWMVFSPNVHLPLIVATGVILTCALAALIRLANDPDSVRAHQSDAMLQLSSSTLDYMQDGLTLDSAQKICELLLPNTAAIAVAITDTEYILGYAGFLERENPQGSEIRTQGTHDVLVNGKMEVLSSAEEIGFPSGDATINAAIIVPLTAGKKVEGTIKFYYRHPSKITATQISIAQGFGRLLSTQIAATELEEQRKLATSMELKMLQSQINPHFLFNTINTIASLIRTDPMKARTLLRDFAVFYRRTLEDSSERIMLSREIEQTMRYFSFEVARFGEERVGLYVGADAEVQDMMVPPFIIQPLVENAVRHAMPSEGKLTISIVAEVEGDDVVVRVSDDGVGMDEETLAHIMHPERSTGMGIAVKNVHDRMKGFFGEDADMKVESKLGEGTSILLRFPDCAVNPEVMVGAACDAGQGPRRAE